MNSWGNQQQLHAVLSTIISFSWRIFKEKDKWQLKFIIHYPHWKLKLQLRFIYKSDTVCFREMHDNVRSIQDIWPRNDIAIYYYQWHMQK